jgi:hypothetical protein
MDQLNILINYNFSLVSAYVEAIPIRIRTMGRNPFFIILSICYPLIKFSIKKSLNRRMWGVIIFQKEMT